MNITTFPMSRLEQGFPVVDALVECGACKSKSEARRLMKQGGVYILRRGGDFERIGCNPSPSREQAVAGQEHEDVRGQAPDSVDD